MYSTVCYKYRVIGGEGVDGGFDFLVSVRCTELMNYSVAEH